MFNILGLPLEIRYQIYETIFDSELLIRRRPGRIHNILSPILFTCKQVYNEALEVFYRRRTIDMTYKVLDYQDPNQERLRAIYITLEQVVHLGLDPLSWEWDISKRKGFKNLKDVYVAEFSTAECCSPELWERGSNRWENICTTFEIPHGTISDGEFITRLILGARTVNLNLSFAHHLCNDCQTCFAEYYVNSDLEMCIDDWVGFSADILIQSLNGLPGLNPQEILKVTTEMERIRAASRAEFLSNFNE